MMASFGGLESVAHQESPAAPALPALSGVGVMVGTLNIAFQLKTTSWRVQIPKFPVPAHPSEQSILKFQILSWA